MPIKLLNSFGVQLHKGQERASLIKLKWKWFPINLKSNCSINMKELIGNLLLTGFITLIN